MITVSFLAGIVSIILILQVHKAFNTRMKRENLPSTILIDPEMNAAHHMGGFIGMDKYVFKVRTSDGKIACKARWGVETTSGRILISRGSINEIVIKDTHVGNVLVMVCRAIGSAYMTSEVKEPVRAWLKEAYPKEDHVGFAEPGKKDHHHFLVTPVDSNVPTMVVKRSETMVREKGTLERLKDRVRPPKPPMMIAVDPEHNTLHYLGFEEGMEQASRDGTEVTRIETQGTRIFLPVKKQHLLFKDFDKAHFLLCNSDHFEKEEVDEEEMERWRSEKIASMKAIGKCKGKEVVVPDDAYPRKTIVTIPV